MSGEITPREALMRLGASTAEALAQALDGLAPGSAERGEVTVLAEGAAPFANLPRGVVASSVSYVDGVTGANVFLLSPAGARALATAMGVPAPEADEAGEVASGLSELELSALSEAANQMMSAAASAIGLVIGQDIRISPPDTRVLASAVAAEKAYGKTPHAISTTFTIAGESSRLVQLVPEAFVMRLLRAIDELSMQDAARSGEQRPGRDNAQATVGIEDALGSVRLRVWAELGRARMPLGRALELPLGAVVDLDCQADDPVDLFVNGVCFGHGHLFVTDDGQWAIVIDEVGDRRAASAIDVPTGAARDPHGRGAAI